MGKEIDARTLDFIFDYTRDGPAQQFADVDALDSKMIQVFSAASVIIGLGGLSSNKGGAISAAFLLLAVSAYVWTGFQAFQHLAPRRVRRSIQADEMWQRGWQLSIGDLKHSVVKDVADAYAHNKGVISEKGKTLRMALLGITAEVVFVGFGLIVVRLV